MNTNKIIGIRMRQMRESNSISLQEMSERSGLDIDQIVLLENDVEIPSLAPLIKIARVLGVRLGTFLDDQGETGPVISRNNNHKKGISFSTNDTQARKHMDYFSLSASKSDRHMEPFIIHVEPIREGADFIASSHEGEEFIYCLEGVLEIIYGNDNYILEEGDSIYYDSIVAHHVHAAGESDAKILAVVYTPL
jgi:transcriptional regulator with XRE-family HTH domain